MDKNMKTILTVLVILGIAYWAGLFNNLGGGIGSSPKVIVNPTPTTTTLTINLKDAYQQGTSITDATKVYVGGVLKDSAVEGQTSVSVSPGAKVTAYGGENSTTYYTKKEEWDIGDAQVQTKQMDLCAFDTSPSIIWYNENDQPSTNITMGTGASESFDVQVKAASYKCVGNPQIPKSLGIAILYNTAEFSKVDLAGADSAACPTFLTQTTSNFVYKCFATDGIASNGKFRNAISVTALSSVDPQVLTSNHDALNVTVIDKDYDFNALTDKEITDFADEDGNNLGMTAKPGTIIGFI